MIHPEIAKDIREEYLRLNKTFPSLTFSFKMALAIKYVRSLAMSNTVAMFNRYKLEGYYVR